MSLFLFRDKFLHNLTGIWLYIFLIVFLNNCIISLRFVCHFSKKTNQKTNKRFRTLSTLFNLFSNIKCTRYSKRKIYHRTWLEFGRILKIWKEWPNNIRKVTSKPMRAPAWFRWSSCLLATSIVGERLHVTK